MKRTQQKIRGQTIDKTIAKPVGVVKNHEKPMICNKEMNTYNELEFCFYECLYHNETQSLSIDHIILM